MKYKLLISQTEDTGTLANCWVTDFTRGYGDGYIGNTFGNGYGDSDGGDGLGDGVGVEH